MFRATTRSAAMRTLSQRQFSSSVARLSHGPEGPYSNLPFKVHNRKVPFAVVLFGFYGVAFAVPGLICYWHLYKSGSL